MIGRNQAGEATMDNAARTRQRIPALFLPLAALLYVAAEALSPKGTDQVVTTTATAFKVLAIAAGHPARFTSLARWRYSGSELWRSRMRRSRRW
jgi:hypothetical protein